MEKARGIESPDGTLSIDKNGTWYYNSLPIINRNILLFLIQHLEHDSQGGYCVRLDRQVCPVQVEDAPFVVTGCERVLLKQEQKQVFSIRLNDETHEHLNLATLYINARNIPYCSVKGQTFTAKFLRPAYYQLAQHVLPESDGRFYVLLNRQKYFIRYAAARDEQSPPDAEKS